MQMAWSNLRWTSTQPKAPAMRHFVYVPITRERTFLIFAMDPGSGKLTLSRKVKLPAQPWQLCANPGQRFLYQQVRDEGFSGVMSFRIDRETGGITQIGEVALEADACCVATDNGGRFLLAAYLIPGIVTVHPIGDDGAAHGPPVDRKVTETYAHSIITDRSNRYAFVPHVDPTCAIHQFLFDQATGKLTANTVPKISPDPGHGPRHLAFHPHLNVLYSNDERASCVTVYRLDMADGTLEAAQNLSTLPDDRFTRKTSTGSVRVHPTGKAVYVSNRGHDSIAAFAVDQGTGLLSPLGSVPAEPVPRVIAVDPDGSYFFAGSDDTDRLCTYRIDARGALHPLEVYDVGRQVAWVLPVKFT